MSESSLPGMNESALFQTTTVMEQVELAKETFRLRLHCPEIAGQIEPGQFFMVRSPHRDDPLLGRPFAVYDTVTDDSGKHIGIDFGYAVIGKMTDLLSHLKEGEELEIWGPLGNGFPDPQPGKLTCVAGGIGYTPFLAVAKEALGHKTYNNQPIAESLADNVSLLYGARSNEYRADLADFEMANFDYQISTDDGSEGHHGFVTELLKKQIESDQRPDRVYCCGPEPMMEAVGEICKQAGIPCWISLETPMACGFGACFSCVTKVKQDDGTWDYRRTCVEGPVFKADEVIL